MNLDEACLLRSNELSQILAGCVALDTFDTLKQIERLHDRDLTDLQARSFILGMREKLPELQAADEEGIIQIIIQVCRDKNCLWDYCYWLTLVRDATQDAAKAVKELQRIAITLNTIANLQEWIKTQEAWIERR
jgi:hypothetical protein